MATITLPETGFIRLKDVLRFIPVGKSTFWARVKAGIYPQPVKLGPNTTAFKAEDIHKLIQRINEQGHDLKAA